MQSTAEVLRSEAGWMHSIGERLESIANEIEERMPAAVPAERAPDETVRLPDETNHRNGEAKWPMVETIAPPPETKNGKAHATREGRLQELRQQLQKFEPLEFFGLKQKPAILKALRTYGQQTRRQVHERLRAGGLPTIEPGVVATQMSELIRLGEVEGVPGQSPIRGEVRIVAGRAEQVAEVELPDAGGLTQADAIVWALRAHGELSLDELLTRANVCGPRTPFRSRYGMSSRISKLKHDGIITQAPGGGLRIAEGAE